MISTAEELDAWYDAAAARVDAVNSNNRNQFNAHMVSVDPIYDDAYNDDVFLLFETAGITPNDNTAPVLNAIRGNNPNTVGRLEQRELLVAVLLDSGTVPVNDAPGKGRAYGDGGFYLKDTNPNANENAFVSHWAKAFGVGRAIVAVLLANIIVDLENIGALNSTYVDFAVLAPMSVQIPLIDAATEFQTEEVFPAVGNEPT